MFPLFASLHILWYSFFVSLHIFDVLSAGVRVFLDCRINFISDFNVLCSWLCTVWNLILFTNSIKSFSKAANSLIGGGIFCHFNACVSILMLFLLVSRYIKFQRIILITILIYSISLKGIFFGLLQVYSSLNNQTLLFQLENTTKEECSTSFGASNNNTNDIVSSKLGRKKSAR